MFTESKHNFHRRKQEPGETVDSFAIALNEFGAKCGFQGDEDTNRYVYQFILGMKDLPTQNNFYNSRQLLWKSPSYLLEDLMLQIL